jgi:hypothetical protein
LLPAEKIKFFKNFIVLSGKFFCIPLYTPPIFGPSRGHWSNMTWKENLVLFKFLIIMHSFLMSTVRLAENRLPYAFWPKNKN